jgi:hypothetical protein
VTGRDTSLKNELKKLETIILKLGKENVDIIHRSMSSFKEHVSHAHDSVLLDFIFPIPIKGLTY